MASVSVVNGPARRRTAAQDLAELDIDLAVIASGQTMTLDGFKFRAGINGGGEPLDPRFHLNMDIRCDTPMGQATYVRSSNSGHLNIWIFMHAKHMQALD